GVARRIFAPALGADDALGERQHGEGDKEDGERARPLAELVTQEFQMPQLAQARHPPLPSGGTLPGSPPHDYSSASVAPFMPSSRSLRVSVLRPQPSSFAASWRCPWVRRSAARISTRSNCGCAVSSSGGPPLRAWRSAHSESASAQSA